MTVDDVVEIEEETHIWKNDKLIFEGKCYRNNPFSKEKVYGAGYEEEIGSEPQKWWRSIILE